MAIRKVCAIGVGTMGSQIGIVCAKAGVETFRFETSEDHVNKGIRTIQAFLEG